MKRIFSTKISGSYLKILIKEGVEINGGVGILINYSKSDNACYTSSLIKESEFRATKTIKGDDNKTQNYKACLTFDPSLYDKHSSSTCKIVTS